MQPNYLGMYQSNPHKLWKIEPNIRDLQEILTPEDDLLDAGCCEGHLYDFLGHKRYTGVDAVARNISAARRRRPEGRFEVGNILELDGVWDIIFCCRVLMHLSDYEKNVEILRKKARKKLLVAIPLGGSSNEIYYHDEWGRETKDPNAKGAIPVPFRVFAPSELGDPERIIKHEKFSTVIYAGRF